MNESFDSNRPQYHFAAPQGTWINDPVPFYEARTGRYHVFLQHNPNAPVWGDMHWLHVSSADLLTWENHGFALAPSRIEGDPDSGGVWTGCITRRPSDGIYVALYTAIPTYKPFTQVQCAAISSDLMNWEKVGENPLTGLSEKPDGYGDCFRDPQTFVGPDGKWYCLIGGEQLGGKGGAAFLYEATDDTLLHWKYRHVLYEGHTETGHDFECPDFFALPGAYQWCAVSSRGKAFWHAGRLSPGDLRLTRESWGSCDNEQFYAAKSCVGPSGERFLWGWIRESRPEAQQVAAGWSGVLSLPRLVSPRSVIDFKPMFLPHASLTALGARHRVVHSGVSAAQHESVLAGTVSDTCELRLTVCLTDEDDANSGAVELVWRSGEKVTTDTILFDGSEATIFVDRSVVEAFGIAAHTYRIYPAQTGQVDVYVRGVGTQGVFDVRVEVLEL